MNDSEKNITSVCIAILSIILIALALVCSHQHSIIEQQRKSYDSLQFHYNCDYALFNPPATND